MLISALIQTGFPVELRQKQIVFSFKFNRLTMQALKEYHHWIAGVDRRCRRIISRHRDQIACRKGCAGNCCRIHLSIYPVEAVSLSLALQRLDPATRRRIERKARLTYSFGPCPLLEDGACSMYHARAVICRTHGLPVLAEYRGRRSIGFCQKNFRELSRIPPQDIIDLTSLNTSLAEINCRFVDKLAPLLPPAKRFTIAEALLIDFENNRGRP